MNTTPVRVPRNPNKALGIVTLVLLLAPAVITVWMLADMREEQRLLRQAVIQTQSKAARVDAAQRIHRTEVGGWMEDLKAENPQITVPPLPPVQAAPELPTEADPLPAKK